MDFDMQKNLTLPVLPLRGLVVFPKSLIHFDVGRKKSITAINKAMKADQLVFLTSQKDAAINEPDIFDVYDTGVIAKVVQVLKQPENTTRIVIEGQCRATIINPVFDEKCLVAEVKPYEEESEYLTARDSALMRTVKNEFDKYLEISPKMPSDIIFKVALCKRPGELADFITANLILDYRVKQSILETFPESERLESVLDVLVNENFVLKLEDEISQKAKMRIDENQRDYFLREQKRAIEEELGEDDSPIDDAENYVDKIEKLNLDEKSADILYKECKKLSKMPYGSQEAAVIRTYLDTVLDFLNYMCTSDYGRSWVPSVIGDISPLTGADAPDTQLAAETAAAQDNSVTCPWWIFKGPEGVEEPFGTAFQNYVAGNADRDETKEVLTQLFVDAYDAM